MNICAARRLKCSRHPLHTLAPLLMIKRLLLVSCYQGLHIHIGHLSGLVELPRHVHDEPLFDSKSIFPAPQASTTYASECLT